MFHYLASRTFRLLVILTTLSTVLSIAQVATARTMMLKKTVFYDQGTQGLVPSHSILVPDGWQADGKAFWAGQQYYNNVPSQDIKLTSPSGMMIHIGPVTNATDYRLSQHAIQQGYYRREELSADDGKIRLNRPETLQAWADFYSRLMAHDSAISGVNVDQVFEITDLSAAIDRQLETERQRIRATSASYAPMNIHQSCNGYGIGLHSTFQYNGVPYEAIRVFVVSTVYTDTQMGRRLDWNINLNITFAAPQGELEAAMPAMVAIASSAREVPNWSRLKAQHLATMKGIALRGFAERSRIIADTHAAVTRIQHETYRRTSAISDRAHRNYINAIREVEIYSQNGETYELPSGYNHVYGDGYGNFILTDNALFNPNTDLEHHAWWSPVSPTP